MKTLRANRGRTSSLGTFWVMAAIRMKDRRGPGMVTVSSAGVAGREAPDCRGAAWRPLPEKQRLRHRENEPSVRRRRCIGRYLLRTWEVLRWFNPRCGEVRAWLDHLEP